MGECRLCRNPPSKEWARLTILAALYEIILSLISLFCALVLTDLTSSPIVLLMTEKMVSAFDL
jgi:hypothetical protein